MRSSLLNLLVINLPKRLPVSPNHFKVFVGIAVVKASKMVSILFRAPSGPLVKNNQDLHWCLVLFLALLVSQKVGTVRDILAIDSILFA